MADPETTQPASKFNVLVGFPFGGRCSPYAFRQAHLSLYNASKQYELDVRDSGSSAGNFNHLWMQGLIAGLNKTHTHYAQIASDVQVVGYKPWIDICIAEMERLDLALISCAVAIKDDRGLSSCGVGDLENDWQVKRRFTVREIEKFPATFNAEDMGYPKHPILHNNQLWVADLRKPFWYNVDKDGIFPCYFNFPERLRLIMQSATAGHLSHDRISEDWMFSRMLHKAGAKTAVHHGFQILHHGEMPYPAHGDWGRLNGDEELADQWRKTEQFAGELQPNDKHTIELGEQEVEIESASPVKLRIVKKG